MNKGFLSLFSSKNISREIMKGLIKYMVAWKQTDW